jgi:putative ATPase
MPEARIPLAQAVTYIATAPKSNAAYMGISRAEEDVREGRTLEVPDHLKDASYPGA